MDFSGWRVPLSTMLAVYAGITSMTWIKTLLFTPKIGLRYQFSKTANISNVSIIEESIPTRITT